MADDIGSRGEDPRDVARRRLNIGRRLREGQVRTAESQASGPRMTPSTRSVVPYREGVPAGGGRGGGGEGSGSRSMAPSGGDRPPAPRTSSGELMRQGAGMGSGASRAGGSRVVGGAGPMAAAGVALGLGSEALRRYRANRADLSVGLEAFGLIGLGGLGAGVHESEHHLSVGDSFGVERDGEEEAGEEAHGIIGRRGRCGSRRWPRRQAGRARSCPCRCWDACP